MSPLTSTSIPVGGPHARARARMLRSPRVLAFHSPLLVTPHTYASEPSLCPNSPFLEAGDPEVLLAAAGHDASAVFSAVGHSKNARRLLRQMAVAPHEELIPPEVTAARARGRCVARPYAADGRGAESRIDTWTETWTQLATGVVSSLRSGEGRARLRQCLRMSVNALVHDLTEGRPDCRRLTPAIWRLAMLEVVGMDAVSNASS